MPFDPFFSSQHKDHFVTSAEGHALYRELKEMPLWLRKKTIWRWKNEGMTPVQKEAHRLISRELNTKYSYRNRTHAEKAQAKHCKAMIATNTVVHLGFHTSASKHGTGGHGFGAK